MYRRHPRRALREPRPSLLTLVKGISIPASTLLAVSASARRASQAHAHCVLQALSLIVTVSIARTPLLRKTTVQWIRTMEDEHYFKRSSLKAEIKAKGSAGVEADAGAEVGGVEWPREFSCMSLGGVQKTATLKPSPSLCDGLLGLLLLFLFSTVSGSRLPLYTPFHCVPTLFLADAPTPLNQASEDLSIVLGSQGLPHFWKHFELCVFWKVCIIERRRATHAFCPHIPVLTSCSRC